MKKYLLLFLLSFMSFFSYSQDYLMLGHNCYEKGDYDCARDNYQKYLQLVPDDQNIINLRQKAGECAIYKIAADKAFVDKDYLGAKNNYEAILNINTYDSYAKERIIQCNNILNPKPTLSVSSENLTFNSYGGTRTISVTTNAENYIISELPTWCSVSKGLDNFTITCNSTITPRSGNFKISANDEEITVNVKQEGAEPILTVSNQRLYFNAKGERINVTVSTNMNSYEITLLPNWCTVVKNANDFTIYCAENPTNTERKDWFQVKAGDKVVRIDVHQFGGSMLSSTPTSTTSTTTSTPKKTQTSVKRNNCFNCPNVRYSWGLTIGYVAKNIEFEDSYFDGNDYTSFMNLSEMKGIQLGFRYEPLFNYGFGLNTGIYYEHFSPTLDASIGGSFDSNSDYQEHVISVPFSLEYRFNFSRYFNIFAYGGFNFEGIVDSYDPAMRFNPSLEYGGGLRIDHVQFNVGRSYHIKHITDISNIDTSPSNQYKNLILSISFMY